MSTRLRPHGIGTEIRYTDLVHVVIPCFNDGAFLQEALDSLGEAYAEGSGVLIVNDGSAQDDTLRELDRLRALGYLSLIHI